MEIKVVCVDRINPQSSVEIFHYGSFEKAKECRFLFLGYYYSYRFYVKGLDVFSGNVLRSCNYMFKVNSKSTRARCEIFSKLTIKTPGVFIVNFEDISRVVLVFL